MRSAMTGKKYKEVYHEDPMTNCVALLQLLISVVLVNNCTYQPYSSDSQ